MALSPEQKALLSRMASCLLNQRSGTATSWRKALDSQERTLLAQMVVVNLVQIVGDQYLPTFRGIEQLDDADICGIVKGNLNWVLRALQRLYKESDESVFDFAAIVQETRRQSSNSLDEKDVLPALILGEQLGYYCFPNGIQKRDDHLFVEDATVFDGILDFTSVEDTWGKLIAQQESRKSKATAQMVDSQRMTPKDAQIITNIGNINIANGKSTINTRDMTAVANVQLAHNDKKRWWETWWGQSAIFIVTSVIAGLIIWAVTRH